MRILIYGYGNPGRQDDGLGIRLSEELENWAHQQGLEGQNDQKGEGEHQQQAAFESGILLGI